jgi:hypothetical protein
VVVVVTDPILVEGRRPRGLNAPDEALLDQDPQGVVDRLSRDGTDHSANVFGDFVRRTVGPTRYRPKYGQALGSNLQAVSAKEIGWIVGHTFNLGPNVDCVNNLVG